MKERRALRPDTTLSLVAEPGVGRLAAEVYVCGLPRCCLKAFKEAVVRADGERLSGLRCPGCGRGWRVESSLDERVLGRFMAHGGERATGGGTHPAA